MRAALETQGNDMLMQELNLKIAACKMEIDRLVDERDKCIGEQNRQAEGYRTSTGSMGGMMDRATAFVENNAAAAKEARAAVNAQSHAEMLRNTDKSGNQLTGSAQPDRRKADDTELRKIALERACRGGVPVGLPHSGDESQIVAAAERYLAFLKGEPPISKLAQQQAKVCRTGAHGQTVASTNAIMQSSGLPG